ncbi:unnamed protein product [Peniophora sp. CBMAI 1063]|nr:unnamed protein product [Peniophora sp. CBMAI 1063]
MRFSFTITLLTLVCASTATLRPLSSVLRRDTVSYGSLGQETSTAGQQQGTLGQGQDTSGQQQGTLGQSSVGSQAGTLGQQQARAYLAQTVLRRNLFPNGSPYTPEEQRRLGEMGIVIARHLVTQENAPFYVPFGSTVPLLDNRGLDFNRFPDGSPLTAGERRARYGLVTQETAPFSVPLDGTVPVARANQNLDFSRLISGSPVAVLRPLLGVLSRTYKNTERAPPSVGVDRGRAYRENVAEEAKTMFSVTVALSLDDSLDWSEAGDE